MSPRRSTVSLSCLLSLALACGGGGGGGPYIDSSITVTIDGIGTGVVRADGFQCGGATCSFMRQPGTQITLTAEPAAGSTFAGWSGGCSGTDPCSFTLRADVTVHAAFSQPGLRSDALGSNSREDVHGLVRDVAGNVTLAASTSAGVTLEGQTVPPGPFLAQYGPDGALRWTRPLAGLTPAGVSIAVEPSGDVVVAGTFSGSIDLGTGGRSSAGGADIVLARIDSSGTVTWAQRYGGVGAEEVFTIAVDAQGHLHLSGDTANGFTFEGQASPLFAFEFIAELTATGEHVRSQSIEGVRRIAFDSQGRRLVTGRRDEAAGGFFITCLNADGTFAWNIFPGLSSYGYSAGVDLHVSPGGPIRIAGHFNGALDLVQPSSSVGADFFFLELTESGQVLSGKSFVNPHDTYLRAFGVDDSGNLFFAGFTQGSTFDLGGGNLISHPDRSNQAFMARFTSDGTHLWSQAFGGKGRDEVSALVTGTGGLVLAGTFEQTVHFGDVQRTSAGAEDIFLISLP